MIDNWWYYLTTSDIDFQKNIKCAEFMRKWFTINFDFHHVGVWIDDIHVHVWYVCASFVTRRNVDYVIYLFYIQYDIININFQERTTLESVTPPNHCQLRRTSFNICFVGVTISYVRAVNIYMILTALSLNHALTRGRTWKWSILPKISISHNSHTCELP